MPFQNFLEIIRPSGGFGRRIYFYIFLSFLASWYFRVGCWLVKDERVPV
jgi:hypothetical protein